MVLKHHVIIITNEDERRITEEKKKRAALAKSRDCLGAKIKDKAHAATSENCVKASFDLQKVLLCANLDCI